MYRLLVHMLAYVAVVGSPSGVVRGVQLYIMRRGCMGIFKSALTRLQRAASVVGSFGRSVMLSRVQTLVHCCVWSYDTAAYDRSALEGVAPRLKSYLVATF
eukprot:Lankesteria_metandrocarpae@DN1683_c0_g1_i1.p1